MLRFRWEVDWLGRKCITTVSFSVLLNGTSHGFFNPSCGLRQGDPLSPFLFIVGSEVLSRLLCSAKLQRSLHGTKVTWARPSISHLLFADDLIIFCRANIKEATIINGVLELYPRWSGQKVNKGKSALYSSKTHIQRLWSTFVVFCKWKKLALNSKYLGLPLFIGGSKRRAFEDVEDKVLSKVAGWKMGSLSQAGRTTLI